VIRVGLRISTPQAIWLCNVNAIGGAAERDWWSTATRLVVQPQRGCVQQSRVTLFGDLCLIRYCGVFRVAIPTGRNCVAVGKITPSVTQGSRGRPPTMLPTALSGLYVKPGHLFGNIVGGFRRQPCAGARNRVAVASTECVGARLREYVKSPNPLLF
jgi:hypothetical protein